MANLGAKDPGIIGLIYKHGIETQFRIVELAQSSAKYEFIKRQF